MFLFFYYQNKIKFNKVENLVRIKTKFYVLKRQICPLSKNKNAIFKYAKFNTFIVTRKLNK